MTIGMSWKISHFLSCRIIEAGGTPSGMNIGSTCPHGVCMLSLAEVSSPSLIWWKALVKLGSCQSTSQGNLAQMDQNSFPSIQRERNFQGWLQQVEGLVVLATHVSKSCLAALTYTLQFCLRAALKGCGRTLPFGLARTNHVRRRSFVVYEDSSIETRSVYQDIVNSG